MKLTIGIKALNEEAHIAAAIESALASVQSIGGDGEVVLADSGSNDRTIEIATQYRIRIIQLQIASEKSCGVGAQLAFQHSQGDYFYLMDGDMVLRPDFIQKGLAFLEQDRSIGAVGGKVVERNTASLEFAIRDNAVASDDHKRSGIVDRLEMGGLYRRAAIEDVGFFADRNLHSFEEYDLGIRLRQAGWKLFRLDEPSVEHFGHTTNSYQLLWKRLRSKYAYGAGEVVRAAVGAPHFLHTVLRFEKVRQSGIVLLWWLLLIAAVLRTAFYGDVLWLVVLLVAPILFLTVRRKSLAGAIYSFVSWNVFTIGFFAGLLRKRRLPTEIISSVTIQ